MASEQLPNWYPDLWQGKIKTYRDHWRPYPILSEVLDRTTRIFAHPDEVLVKPMIDDLPYQSVDDLLIKGSRVNSIDHYLPMPMKAPIADWLRYVGVIFKLDSPRIGDVSTKLVVKHVEVNLGKPAQFSSDYDSFSINYEAGWFSLKPKVDISAWWDAASDRDLSNHINERLHDSTSKIRLQTYINCYDVQNLRVENF